MNPDAESGNTPNGHVDTPSSQVAEVSDEAGASTRIDALSAASSQYARGRNSHRTGGMRRVSWKLAVIASLLVGTATTCSGRFTYRCGAVFRISGPAAESRMTFYRKELLDFAWRESGPPSADPGAAVNWSVDSPEPKYLRYCVVAHDRQATVQRVRGLAERFLAHLTEDASNRRTTPSHTEQLILGASTDLQARLDQATRAVEQRLADLPEDDPRQDRAALLKQWETHRSSFLHVRGRLNEASARRHGLKSDGEPTEGVVDPEERRAALSGVVALQQDLKELRVNLTEAKLHLLNVWQASSALLDQLSDAAETMVQVANDRPDSKKAPSPATTAESMVSPSTEFLTELVAFSADWHRDFLTLREMVVDPQRNDLLTLYDRLRSCLRDFLFKAPGHLSEMNAGLKKIGDAPGDSARDHVRRSNLMRAYQRLDNTYHRFEFEAGRIDPRDNFKLDAALRAARGLTRRSRRQAADVETQLETRALLRAKQTWASDFDQATQEVERLRSEADTIVAQLVDIQTQLNLSSQLTESYVRKSLLAEAAQTHAQWTDRDLTRTQAIAGELRSNRIAATEGAELKLVTCTVLDGPVNLPSRLSFGLIAALATLLSTLAAQWWLARRE